jgi:hypothetical protein
VRDEPAAGYPAADHPRDANGWIFRRLAWDPDGVLLRPPNGGTYPELRGYRWIWHEPDPDREITLQ